MEGKIKLNYNNDKFEIIQPGKEVMDMVQEIIKQNGKIIEINNQLVEKMATHPMWKVTGGE